MAYSNQTTHYGLPLPVGSDKSSWLDNNTAFAAIDTAIYQASTDAGAAAGDIAQLQNDVTSLQSGKQDTLTWDASPTNGSLNAVRSGGVYTAIDNVSIALGVTDLKVSTLEGAMGTTDISAIGDGTVTGAISAINSGSAQESIETGTSAGTYGSKLAELYALIDFSKITGASYIKNMLSNQIFKLNFFGTNEVRYVVMDTNDASQPIRISQLVVASTAVATTAVTTSSGSSFADITTSAFNGKLVLYY